MYRNRTISLWFVMSFAAGTASAATYHVRADGTAPVKELATGCASPATAMSVATVNGEPFAPGDRVVLCHEGGVFRTILYLTDGSEGTEAEPIVYDGRGTAVLSGSDLVSGWTSSGADTYVASVAIQPSQVFFDGEFGDRKGGLEELTDDHDWYWETNSLHVFSAAGNPDTIFSEPGVEAGARDTCFGVGQVPYVIVENLTARHANQSGIFGWSPGAHLTVRNVTAEWNWHSGLLFNSSQPPDPLVPFYNLKVEHNTVRFNGTGGIAVLGPAVDAQIYRNRCYENGRHQSKVTVFDEEQWWTYGIKLWDYSLSQNSVAFQEGTEIYFNECFDNGRGNPGDNQGLGVGIWVDGVRGNPDNPVAIRFNKVRDNMGNGIFIELSSNTVVQSNVLHNNATNSGGTDGFAAANIAIDARATLKSENNRVFNNTSYGGRYGVKVVTYDWRGCEVNDNQVINNVIVEASEHNLYCNFGGDNDGANGSGNVYAYNNLGEERPGMVNWGNLPYDTYAAWESVYGQDSHSLEGDPRLAGDTHETMFLTSPSPCRDTGSTLGEDYDDTLRETSAWTESVGTEDQDLLGSGWDIGAFAFTGEGSRFFSDGFESGGTDQWTDTVD